MWSIFEIFLINPLGGKQLFSYQVGDGCGAIKVRYLIEILKSQRGECLNVFWILGKREKRILVCDVDGGKE